MPRTSESNSTNPKSATSALARDTDDAIQKLREKLLGRKVSLHGFNPESSDPIQSELNRLLKKSVVNFLTQCYGLQVVPLGHRSNLIVANEATPATISKLSKQASSIHRNTPAILVLCAQSSRFDRNVSPDDLKCKIGFVAKPVGPLKLAKAITQCLEGIQNLSTPILSDSTNTLSSNDLSNVFEELSVSAHGRAELLDNSRMATDSDNARKAIESPTPNAVTDKKTEFPFPATENRAPVDQKSIFMIANKDILNPQSASKLAPPAASTLSPKELASASQSTPKPSPIPDTEIDRPHAPSLLLVDDNKINLKLLSTYMTKKKYPIVHHAENGLEAVTKFQERIEGYDIIFMDISMPILDGFGATRQIREIERVRRKKISSAGVVAVDENISPSAIPDTEVAESPSFSEINHARDDDDSDGKMPALIIALTGLASGRDQQEAAAVGVDIFLTKPVSFKEVGKLLDNWEKNKERDCS